MTIVQPCGCGGAAPVTGRRVGTTAALTASASSSWNVRLPDGTMHPDGPWRSLIKAQGVAGRTGGRVV